MELFHKIINLILILSVILLYMMSWKADGNNNDNNENMQCYYSNTIHLWT